MRRSLPLAAAVSSAALLILAGSASAAPSGPTVDIKGGQSFIPDVSLTDNQHFEKRVITVRSGQTVTWRNFTAEPHTISVVASADVPKTIQQVFGCDTTGPCKPFEVGHIPAGPTQPGVAFLDDLSPSTADPKLDSAGDSLAVAPQGASFPTTTGGVVGDTVSATVAGAPGTRLDYICALHPWMQGVIRIAGAGQHAED